MYCDLSRTTGSRPIPREVRPSCPKVPREPCALWPRWPSSTLTIGVLYLWLTTSLISGTKTGRARDKTESSKLRATASCAPRRQRPVLGPLSLCPLTVAVVALAMTGPRPPVQPHSLGCPGRLLRQTPEVCRGSLLGSWDLYTSLGAPRWEGQPFPGPITAAVQGFGGVAAGKAVISSLCLSLLRCHEPIPPCHQGPQI